MYWNLANFLIITGYELWLTLTWDVLKFHSCEEDAMKMKRLTLTWDVLKYIIGWHTAYTITD